MIVPIALKQLIASAKGDFSLFDAVSDSRPDAKHLTVVFCTFADGEGYSTIIGASRYNR